MCFELNRLLGAGLVLIVAGSVIVVVGSAARGAVSSGGFILVGPFPIVFGTGPSGSQLADLALAVGILMFVLIALFAMRIRSLSSEVRGNP